MNDETIEKQLRDKTETEINLRHFTTIGSTNRYAKHLTQQQPIQVPYLIWADQQTAGTGKLARPFYSSSGGLYLSLILPNKSIDPQKIGLFTTSLALAGIKAIKACFSIAAQVKWVNDIYLNQRKIVGILVGRGANQTIIIGIGVNLFQANFPTEISQTAGNLLTSPPSDSEKDQFLISLVSHLYKSSMTYTNPQFISEYKHSLNLMSQQVELKMGHSSIIGKVIDINSLGQLVILDSVTKKARSISAGEVIKVYPNHLSK
ncbi:biotin--[acetyl-CoA-carboxylase] ligase [Lactobacillus sp. LC28-10]|uniref:Biotin--[acetyl-CoA-carboxylase] ligase n=1 Tax=Secundilactobacillus angelensis TaxID=2722706 RepID=A0ABX1KZ73_9LACO|nr:biotin--[acetyl-CoA-carboxylase] ligase [Secundilactobacillus angelensis]MCH5463274.1 biotin--[acetyl-CoA-carboxylase] ligase [Secundilactobacillus angelensis]NLR19243.1 biotin--[acetyl-CoA-carboxylase] ligase [Secundilactobacillus angelensis]